ncbi:MAG: hypothetical protein K5871_00375 [Lachnospiraceae bacterium]|nr:hypothetical protein [Lachnospiraceae bacterium]
MKYTIGKYEFDDEKEYEKALKEVDLIKSLERKYDLKDEKICRKLVELGRQGKLPFYTPVGKDFLKLLETRLASFEKAAKSSAAKPSVAKASKSASEKSPKTSAVKGSDESRAEDKTGDSTKEQKPDRRTAFIYCYLPWIALALIVPSVFAYSRMYLNIQLQNLVFVLGVIILYALFDRVSMLFIGGFIKRKQIVSELKKNYLPASICIPKKIMALLVAAFIIAVIYTFAKPFFSPSATNDQKIEFREEMIRS